MRLNRENEWYVWNTEGIPESQSWQKLQCAVKRICWVSVPWTLQAQEWIIWSVKITFQFSDAVVFPLKTNDHGSYFALVYFPKDKSHTKEGYTDRVEKIYAVCQYPIQRNELLSGKFKKENIKLHIKED